MLSLVGQDLKKLSLKETAEGNNIQHIDVSFNQLTQGV